MYVNYSLYHMRLIWRAIGGTEESTGGGGLRLLEAACATALHYADLLHGALADLGYYENHGMLSLVFCKYNFLLCYLLGGYTHNARILFLFGPVLRSLERNLF